jgi:ketohexokinase
MANILLVGIATLDIINTVTQYPTEDSELRAISQQKSRGGNATNTAVVLAQHSHHCAWAGTLINETDTQTITDDLRQYDIDLEHCHHLDTGKMPTSYITRNQATGSRTIVHYRDCPEYQFEQFKQIPLEQFDWVHFEGRAVDETLLMLTHLKSRYPFLRSSLEVEKSREGIETLFSIPDFLFFSKHYAEEQQCDQANALLAKLSDEIEATCTWGSEGVWVKNKHQAPIHIDGIPPAELVDTLGAGDTFNAGLIHQLVNYQSLESAARYANQLASHKCGQVGFAQLLSTFSN